MESAACFVLNLESSGKKGALNQPTAWPVQGFSGPGSGSGGTEKDMGIRSQGQAQ